MCMHARATILLANADGLKGRSIAYHLTLGPGLIISKHCQGMNGTGDKNVRRPSVNDLNTGTPFDSPPGNNA